MTRPPDGPVPFPFSRSGLSARQEPARDLGLTPLSRSIDPTGARARGHWCPDCKGIWWSALLEAECPVCGHRG